MKSSQHFTSTHLGSGHAHARDTKRFSVQAEAVHSRMGDKVSTQNSQKILGFWPDQIGSA
jgi:hypothetical protein